MLFTGVASCCIGMLEASQEVVKALESRNLSLPFQAQPAENSANQSSSTIAQSPVAVPIAPTHAPANAPANSLNQTQEQAKSSQPGLQQLTKQQQNASSATASATADPSASTSATGQTASQTAGQAAGQAFMMSAAIASGGHAAKGSIGSTTTTPASSAAVAPKAAAKTLQSNLRAISTGVANDPQQAISQVAPTQIAANAWYGASFPVENFQEYTSPFGYRYSPTGGYSQEFHYGLDFAAPEGSYIRNWWSGKVVEVSDNSNCGTSVVVESGDWLHIYCHMQGYVESANGRKFMIDREGGIQVFEGQDLPAGTRVGRVGMTGRTTGPHLHWGLKYQEKWVDPALVLRAMYTSQQSTASR